MKREDILVVYEAVPQQAIKLINSLSIILANLKERINPVKESKKGFKEK